LAFQELAYMKRALAMLGTVALLASLAGAQSRPPQNAAESAPAQTDLQLLLAHIEVQAEGARQDLAELNVGRWRTNSRQKREALGRADSLERNLREALPGMVVAVREAPEGFAASFRLYRNLNALHDVMGVLAESAGAFGSRDEFSGLAERARFFDQARRTLADRLEAMAEARDAELARWRAAERLRSVPPKKIIVDQEMPRPRKRQ
jgi:hypothetical protein